MSRRCCGGSSARIWPRSRSVSMQVDLLVLGRFPDAFDEDVVAQRPLPSMLMAMPSSLSRPVKASLLNCEPWSVLKISGFSFLERASSRASRQNETSMVIDSRKHAATEPVHHCGQINEPSCHGDNYSTSTPSRSGQARTPEFTLTERNSVTRSSSN